MGIDFLISIFVVLGMVLTIILIGNTRARPRRAIHPDPEVEVDLPLSRRLSS